MALDGITISAIVKELREYCLEGRIGKITQPEKDEIMLTIKQLDPEGKYRQSRVVLSANASLPLVYITDDNKVSPENAPTFCMFLRKHILNGRITDIYQPDFERIIVFEVEHFDEMGDLKQKRLIIELMGKYSNIIFTDNENKILESIKHISSLVSSVREVLPGCSYFVPMQEDRINPLESGREEFVNVALCKPNDTYKAIYTTYKGIAPSVATEVCGSVEGADGSTAALSDSQKEQLWIKWNKCMNAVRDGEFTPTMFLEGGAPIEYGVLPPVSYSGDNVKEFDSVSKLLIAFYAQKEKATRIKQRSVDLRKIVTTIYERDIKKYDLQLKQLRDTEKMDKYKVYGELLHTYGYSAPQGAKQITVDNYYTGQPLTIPLDPDLSASENAKKYFDKYGKLKRTKEALTELTVSVENEIKQLESIMNSLEIAEKEEDLAQIKDELTEGGFIKKKGGKTKQRFKSKPFHYISSDGFHIYVGKNNIQNEELTFKVATGNDWWFHAKGRPGSHVIVKCDNGTPSDKTFEEAARLAAHYSKAGKTADNNGEFSANEAVEVDYVQKKHVKKSPGQPMGFVIYHTNYSMLIGSRIDDIERVE